MAIFIIFSLDAKSSANMSIKLSNPPPITQETIIDINSTGQVLLPPSFGGAISNNIVSHTRHDIPSGEPIQDNPTGGSTGYPKYTDNIVGSRYDLAVVSKCQPNSLTTLQANQREVKMDRYQVEYVMLQPTVSKDYD